MTESKAIQHSEPEMKGWLNKWTNYLKGYQKRWFVLSAGLLSYYRNQAEMAHTCRGSISLHGAVIHTEDSCNFVISNGGTQTFHLKASSEVERQRWVTALELAKVKAIRAMESEDEEMEDPAQSDKNELQGIMKVLGSKLEDLQTCTDLIVKHGTALQRSLSELESLDDAHEAASKIKAVNERATLFRITATAMINACSDYLNLAQCQGRKWLRVLQHEHDQRMRLEEMVEQLARQHSHLEMAAQQHQKTTHMNHSDEDEETEFFDAMETTESFTVTVPLTSHRRTSSCISTGSQVSEGGAPTSDIHGEVSGSSSEVEDAMETTARVIPSKQKGAVGMLNMAAMSQVSSEYYSALDVVKKKRRLRVPDKPNYPLNLWSIMKNCIGKDLTKIPMPVNFSEPLSMLQRLTEDYEYSEILDMAARCEDSCEQLAYVAAFTVSSYATTSVRTGKPFNPLLGETFECDRTDDMGWRSLSEQVSHHPPVAAQYCEGRGWKCWQEFSMSSKFRGKYLQVIPLGIAHLTFDKSGNHYTWRKVSTTVHNIIVGKLWVDQSGEMDIVNHLTEEQCHLKFIPYSYFNRDVQRKVTGCVLDKDGSVKWVLKGTWDGMMEAAEVLNTSGEAEKGNSVLETGSYRLLWKRNLPPPESERYYNFTVLASQLNEREEGMAPTDSRHRPDQRLMEEGRWDEANAEKLRLEDKQRGARKRRETDAEIATGEGRPYCQYEPVWFRKEKDTMTGNVIHVYQGQYWACKEMQDWSRCPDIY